MVFLVLWAWDIGWDSVPVPGICNNEGNSEQGRPHSALDT